MHDSFQPLRTLVPLINLLLGEIIYGGPGTGLCGMVFVALVAICIGGLMVGCSPKYLGPPKTKIIAVYTLREPATVLVLTALAVLISTGRDGLKTSAGSHGLTEIFMTGAGLIAGIAPPKEINKPSVGTLPQAPANTSDLSMQGRRLVNSLNRLDIGGLAGVPPVQRGISRGHTGRTRSF